MKEFRPGSSGRSELRILFAFDPERAAILLIAGSNKAGNWTRWYKANIPLADDLFDEHLHDLRSERAKHPSSTQHEQQQKSVRSGSPGRSE